MENKEKLSEQTNDLQKKEKIKNLDKDQLDSASGGVISAAIGLGALAGLGAATATAAATAYAAHKAPQKSDLKAIMSRGQHGLNEPDKMPVTVKNTNLPMNNDQSIDELINKLYNANKEYVSTKARTNAYQNGKIDSIDDVEQILKI